MLKLKIFFLRISISFPFVPNSYHYSLLCHWPGTIRVSLKSDQFPQSLIQSGLKNLQGCRLGHVSNLFQCLTNFREKKVFVISRLNLSRLNLPLILLPHTAVNNAAPSPWGPPHRYWGAAVRMPWSHLFRLNKPNSLNVSFQDECFGVLPLNSLQLINVFLAIRSPKTRCRT